jgi:ABC-type phosphate transport system substrate-binding protein
LFAAFGCLSSPVRADEAVVVNPAVPADSLSSNALRAIFGMRLRAWPDGSPVRVFVLRDDSPVHIEFAKQRLSIFPHQLRRAWDRGVYSGIGQAPTTLDSEAEMRAIVASTTGAIGYLPTEMVNANVRVIEVE